MTNPSRCEDSGWRWRTQVNKGRLEAMIEVRDWLASKVEYAKAMAQKPKARSSQQIVDSAVAVVLEDLWVTIAANCERKGKWASSIPMETKEPPKPDWSRADKDKEIKSIRALIERHEDDSDLSTS